MKKWNNRLLKELGFAWLTVACLLALPLVSGATTPGDLWVFGRLYNGPPILQPMVPALTEVVAIDNGYMSNMNLALRADGTVWNWQEGQLYARPYKPFILTQVPGLTDVKAISAGDRHSLALKNDGTVWAWGANNRGQLGNGTYTTSNVPVQVIGLTGIVAIETGLLRDVSYAIKEDGTVWTWGVCDIDYVFGPWSPPRNLPVQVSEITDVVDIKSGEFYTIALKTDGTVWWWGTRFYVLHKNLYGKVPFEEIYSTAPRQMPGFGLPGITDVRAIAQGYDHSLVILDDNTLWGWGQGGVFGDGSYIDHLTPVQISTFSNVVTIHAFNLTNLATLSDGTVWGWSSKDTSGIISLGIGCTAGAYDCMRNNRETYLIPQLQNAFAISVGGGYGQAIFPPANELPIANNQSVSVDEDSSVTITLSATDGNGDALTYSIASSPLHGSLTGTSANPTYTPTADFNGNDSFTFVVNDGTGDSAPATVSITVTPVNDPPEAENQSASVDEDFYVDLVLTGSDRDGDVLTYSVVTSPLHGSLSGTGPNMTYTPMADFNGYDSFTFVSHDGVLDSIPATVSITVMPVNDAPVALANVLYAAPLVPGNSVTLDGSGSTDIDSVIQFYSWTILQPDGTSISIPDQILPQTAFSIDMTGDYLIELLVHDGALNSPVDTISITVISIATASTDLVNDTVAIMAELPVDVFNNKNNQTPLTNKFNVVLEMIAQGSYQIAFDKLNNDIKLKTDGCANSGAPDNNDWIQDCPSQNLLYPQIEEVLSLLQRLL